MGASKAKKELKYEISADSSKYVAGARRAAISTEVLHKGINNLSEKMGKAGLMAAAGAATAALAGIGTTALNSIKSFAEWERRLLRTESLIRATGDAAGLTTAELSGLAKSLGGTTLAGTRNEYMDAINAMQTFKAVQGDVFKDAIRLSADLGEALGVQLVGQAVQLGKALEAPITGISSLAEVGVTFSESQKEMIKAMMEAGQQVEAQRVILKVLEEQVGGAAVGAAGGLAGKMNNLSSAWTNFAESVAGSEGAINGANTGLDMTAQILERLSKVNFDELIPLLGMGSKILEAGHALAVQGQAVSGKIGLQTPGFGAYAAETGKSDEAQAEIAKSVYYGGTQDAHIEAWQQRKELEGQVLSEIAEQYWGHNETLLSIDQSGMDGRLSIYRQEEEERLRLLQRREEIQRMAASQAVSDAKFVAQVMGKESKAAFKAYQAISIAEAGVTGYRAAVKAWDAGMSTGGPYAPVIAAAYTSMSLLKTGALIRSMGGSGGGGGGGGGGSSSFAQPADNVGAPRQDPAMAESEGRGKVVFDFRGATVMDPEKLAIEVVNSVNDLADKDVYINYAKEIA